MKKLIVGTVCLLMLAGAASADTTQVISELNHANAGDWFAPDGTNMPMSYSIYLRISNQDWGYTHSFGADAAAQLAAIENIDLSTVMIDSATLAIDAYDVDNPTIGQQEIVDISIKDGTDGAASYASIGNLTGEDAKWIVSNFDLAANLDDLENGELDVWVDLDKTLTGSAAGLRSSRLAITYSYDLLPPEPPAVPAPGAVLLSGLGAGLVGWMRRRRSL